MTGSILVLNAGSSSLKFALYELGKELQLRFKGSASRLAGEEARLRVRSGKQALKDELLGGPLSVVSAAERTLDWLSAGGYFDGLRAIGHRIVHGGRAYSGPAVLDEDAIDNLARLVPLAPLHQPFNLEIVRLAARRAPKAVQIGCFDTSFHADRPLLERLYGLPRQFSEEGVLAYGFHGLSYEHVAGRLKAHDGDRAGGRTIVAHLGSGASMCAMKEGRSIATTMGFSALEGLVMATRCGSIDPGVLLHLIQERGMTPGAVADLLYQKSGLLGVSGVSGDMAALLQSDDPAAQEAVDLFVYRAGREIGSLAAALKGLDTLVFTAGIGENSAEIRARICAACEWLGVTIDYDRNQAGDFVISAEASTVTTLIVPTDEERSVAAAVQKLLGLGGDDRPANVHGSAHGR